MLISGTEKGVVCLSHTIVQEVSGVAQIGYSYL